MSRVGATFLPLSSDTKAKHKKDFLKIVGVAVLVFAGIGTGLYFIDKSHGWSWLSTKNVYKGLGYGGGAFTLILTSSGIAHLVQIKREDNYEKQARLERETLQRDLEERYPLNNPSQELLTQLLAEKEIAAENNRNHPDNRIFAIKIDLLLKHSNAFMEAMPKQPPPKNLGLERWIESQYPESDPQGSLQKLTIELADRRRMPTQDKDIIVRLEEHQQLLMRLIDSTKT